jgi:hypothetical protein
MFAKSTAKASPANMSKVKITRRPMAAWPDSEELAVS